MSKLKNEIKGCMTDLSRNKEGVLAADFYFPKTFIGFRGHFSGKPILPGVCKIQATLLMLEEFKQKNILLKEIILAKFFSPVSCDEKINFNLKEQREPNGQICVKAIITGGNRKIAELHLRLAIID